MRQRNRRMGSGSNKEVAHVKEEEKKKEAKKRAEGKEEEDREEKV